MRIFNQRTQKQGIFRLCAEVGATGVKFDYGVETEDGTRSGLVERYYAGSYVGERCVYDPMISAKSRWRS
jgi:hypothetical protein